MDSDAMWDIVDIDAKFYSARRKIKIYLSDQDKKNIHFIQKALTEFATIQECISRLNTSAGRASTVLASMNSCITEIIEITPKLMDEKIHAYTKKTYKETLGEDCDEFTHLLSDLKQMHDSSAGNMKEVISLLNTIITKLH